MSDLKNRLLEKVTREEQILYPCFPKKNLLIEVTNSCNENCIFCGNSKMQRTRGFIKPELVYKVLTDAYVLGTREVGFYTTGEALLNKDLEKYIEYAKKLGYNYIYLTTNAVLLEEDRIKSLVKAGIDSIKLSINAINQKEYQFIHGVDCFEKVISNLEKLYNYRNDNNQNFKIYVSYIATRYTDHSRTEIEKVFKDKCDEVAIVNVRNQGGYMPENNELLSCLCEDNKIPSERKIPCHYIFNTLNVTYEGYLTACCTDFDNYLVYADLNKESLKEAWHNSIITNLRKKHLENQILNIMCYNCIYGMKEFPKPLCSEYGTESLQRLYQPEKILTRIKKYINS